MLQDTLEYFSVANFNTEIHRNEPASTEHESLPQDPLSKKPKHWWETKALQRAPCFSLQLTDERSFLALRPLFAAPHHSCAGFTDSDTRCRTGPPTPAAQRTRILCQNSNSPTRPESTAPGNSATEPGLNESIARASPPNAVIREGALTPFFHPTPFLHLTPLPQRAGGRADGARRRWTPRLSLPAPSGAAGPRRNPSAWRKRRSEGSGKQAARTERSRRRWARPRPTVPGRAAQRAGRLRAPTPALPRGPSAPRLSPTASDPRPAPPQLSDPAPPHGPAPPHRPGCPRASRRPGSAAAARRSSTARRAGPGPQRHLPAPARRSAEEPRFRGRARLQPASAPPHPSHRPSCSPAPGGGRGGAPQREGGKNGAAINVQTDWECAPTAGTAEKDTAPQECFMTLFILRNYWDSEAPKRSIIPKAEGRFHFPYSCCFAFFQKHVQGGI